MSKKTPPSEEDGVEVIEARVAWAIALIVSSCNPTWR
jgi:hypothetical protein